MHRLLRLLIAAAALLGGVACTPALNWRLASLGGGLQVQFPCRPSPMERVVALAGSSVRMTLHSCTADGGTYAVAVADVPDPSALPAVLAALSASAATNLGQAAPAVGRPLSVAGLPPGTGASRVRLAGKLPDGAPVEEEVVVFGRGTSAYQVTVFKPMLDAEAVDTFFESLRFP